MLTPIPLYRVMSGPDDFRCMVPEPAWRAAAERVFRELPARDRVTVCHASPFDQCLTFCETPTTTPPVQVHREFGRRFVRANCCSESIRREFFPGASGTNNVPVMEDLGTAEYVVAICGIYDAVLPKEPGVSIHGHVFVGNVVLVRGREVVDASSRAVVDENVDFEPLSLDALGITWLNAKQAIAARRERRARLLEIVSRERPDRIVGSGVGLDPLPSAERAACWNCGSLGDASQKQTKCSTCKRAYYCDRACQESHWKTHKKHCSQV